MAGVLQKILKLGAAKAKHRGMGDNCESLPERQGERNLKGKKRGPKPKGG